MVTHIPPSVSDPKRPYGGLVPSQPKGQRAYFDAATYNHQLAQHQAYTAQAASQAANATRNPYMVPHPPQQAQAPPSSASYQNSPDVSVVSYQPQHHSHPHSQYGGQNANRGLAHQTSAGQLTGNVGPAPGQYGAASTHGGGGGANQAHLNPASGSGNGPGSGTYFPNSRARANTINQMDAVPPALARLQHMNQDVISGRNALTPVLNRDDAMREWERRQQGGKPAQVQPYPQLEYLQQQAEMATAAGGLGGWAATAAAAAALGIHPHGHNHRYPPPPSKLSQSYHPQTLLVDDDSSRRDAILSNVRSVARGDNGPPGQQGQQQQQPPPPPASAGIAQQAPPPPPQGGAGIYGTGSGGAAISISSPPQAYSGNMAVTGNRFAATYGGPQAPPPPQSQGQQHQGGNPGANGGGSNGGGSGVSTFDSIDRRTDIGSMYVPMQPDNYHHQHPQHQHQYGGPGNSGPQGPPRHVAPPQQAVPPSFYGAGVVPSGAPPSSHSQQGQQGPPPPGQGQGQQGQQGQQQRNPFTSMPVPDPGVGVGGMGKPDVRRGNGLDAWPR